MGEAFNYAEEFKKLDLQALDDRLFRDISAVVSTTCSSPVSRCTQRSRRS